MNWYKYEHLTERLVNACWGRTYRPLSIYLPLKILACLFNKEKWFYLILRVFAGFTLYFLRHQKNHFLHGKNKSNLESSVSLC